MGLGLFIFPWIIWLIAILPFLYINFYRKPDRYDSAIKVARLNQIKNNKNSADNKIGDIIKPLIGVFISLIMVLPYTPLKRNIVNLGNNLRESVQNMLLSQNSESIQENKP